MKVVLFLSPFPPPYGGVATLTKVLFEKGLPSPYVAQIIDTKSLGPGLINNLKRELGILSKLLYRLIWKRPSVIHLNCSVSPVGVNRDLICVLMARILGVPVLTHYHGNLADYNVKEKYKISSFTLKNLIRLSSINIYSNKPSMNFALKIKGLNLNPTMNLVLPNYASDKIWDYRHIPKNLPTITCAFVGTLCRAKGSDLILDLANALPDFNFHLIGRIMPDVADLLNGPIPVNLKLCGVMDQLEVYEYLQKVDLLIFPSLTEGFPLAMVEAMAIGLPVVCTNVGSLPEMIDENKGGYVLKPGDEIGFQSAIQKFANFELRQGAAIYNYTKAKNEYSFDSVANRLVNSYNLIS